VLHDIGIGWCGGRHAFRSAALDEQDRLVRGQIDHLSNAQRSRAIELQIDQHPDLHGFLRHGYLLRTCGAGTEVPARSAFD
jgi:hypothetical protein